MTTRTYILLTFFTCVAPTPLHAQVKQDKGMVISKIKKLYQQINSYKNFRTVTINDSERFLGHSTDNGGSLTGYYKSDSLKKIREWVGLSYKVILNEYYFDTDKLIFVYSVESRYRFNDSTQGFDYTKLDNVFTGRYYFANDKLVKTILSGKDAGAAEHQDAGPFLASGSTYIKLLKTKRK